MLFYRDKIYAGFTGSFMRNEHDKKCRKLSGDYTLYHFWGNKGAMSRQKRMGSKKL